MAEGIDPPVVESGETVLTEIALPSANRNPQDQ